MNLKVDYLILGLSVILVIFISGCVQQKHFSSEKPDTSFYQSQVGIEGTKVDAEKIEEQEITRQNSSDINQNFLDPPTNLVLPFDVEHMFGGNEFISPFGLIRHERDKEHGHAGIDIPLSKGDKIYAVTNGTIIFNEPATNEGNDNNFEGNNVILLITKGREGEGWGFLYEHIHLNSEINVGSPVRRKQFIGTSALTNGNNHFGLVYYFNDFKYTKEPKCWVEHLTDEDKQSLLHSWDQIKINPTFIGGWKNSFEDEAYAYTALLNKDRFPAGPQLCYEYGLDVREFK